MRAGRGVWVDAVLRTGSRVVLTVAHLGEPFATGADKHDKSDIRAENLAALCQCCHLSHDARDHAYKRHANREAQRQKTEPLLF